MASDNNTVKEIVKRVRRECDSYPPLANAAEMLRLVREIEAAHKREIAAKDAEIENLKKKIDEYERQPELMAETAREALRTLQEQDAVIAELRERIKEADEFATEMKQSTNSQVRACGHQMILRLARKRR